MADDFATEHLEMIAVTREGLVGECVLQEIDQKGSDGIDDASADGHIVVLNRPEFGPVHQVRAEFVEGGAPCRDNRDLIVLPTPTHHAAHPRAQCLSPLPRLCLPERKA